MKNTLITLVGLFAFASALQAHPHDDVEQQALLSIGLDKTTVEVRIVPSFDEGADIFAHLDQDSDGTVSEDEATEFGQQVLAQSTLAVDGELVELSDLKVVVPEAEQVSSGLGVITISSTGVYPKLGEGESHHVAFQITYEDLAHGWFIQPFFFSDLDEKLKMQKLDRTQEGLSIDVTFVPKDD